jgi:anti-sigma factor RsiW
MKCIDSELLQRFFDGECSNEEAIEMELHMSACQNCLHRYEALQARVKSINQAFGVTCSDTIDIPAIPLPKPARKHIPMHQKYLVLLLAAASILLFILVYNTKQNNNMSGDQMSQSCFTGELDANKPVYQQELSFTVISPEGKVSEDVVR